MDKIIALSQRNPVVLAREVGLRLKRLRLAKGWSQEELAAKSGVAISTLKLLEAKGNGSFQRLIHVAIALGVDGELCGLFSNVPFDSITSIKLSERQRAPRRPRKEAGGV